MPLLIMIRKNVNQDTIRYLSKSTRLIRFKSLATWFVGGDSDGRKINKCGESAAENHSNRLGKDNLGCLPPHLYTSCLSSKDMRMKARTKQTSRGIF